MLLIRSAHGDASVINGREFQVPLSSAPVLSSDGGCIEIVGRSGTGKTQLALATLLPFILPATWNGVRLNGADGCAVWIDCRSRPPHDIAARIEQIIQKTFGGAVSGESLALLSARCCDRIYYARANAVTALVCALIQAERLAEERNSPAETAPIDVGEYLRDSDKRPRNHQNDDANAHANTFSQPSQQAPPQPHSSSPPLRAVVIDDVAAFFWAIRDGEQTVRNRRSELSSDNGRAADTADRPLLPTSSSSYYNAVSTIAERIERRFGCAVVMTKSVIFASDTTGDILPQTYTRIVAHRIQLTANQPNTDTFTAKYSRTQAAAASATTSTTSTSASASASWTRAFGIDESGLRWC